MIIKTLLTFISLFLATTSQANLDEVHADDYITSFGIAAKAIKHIKLSIPKFIGACVFKDGTYFPDFYFTPAIEQLLPDLIVSVYSAKDSNPYKEIKEIYESSAALKVYKKTRDTLSSQLLKMVVPSSEGSTSGQASPVKGRSEQTRIVDVIGAPSNLIRIPFLTHNTEPFPFTPYYLSQLDEFVDRTAAVELIYAATHPHLAISSPIGSEFNLWGTELPRSMRVNNPYRFRASVVAAMHGADLATNNHSMHVMLNNLSNSCGQNCVISNVIYDPNKSNIVWQEVFPNERIITPGSSNDLGVEDDRKGKGNYVFLVWRKYRGCIQAPGRLLYKTINVGSPVKR